MGKEEEELKQLWSVFEDLPKEVKERRQQLIQTVNENDLTSFPSTLLVSTAFDELFQCFSVGGQVKNYYRYGKLSYCEKQREKLWFAMRHGQFMEGKTITENSSLGELESAKKVQEFYKKQLMETKAHGSSEDIWNVRKEKLVQPFKED